MTPDFEAQLNKLLSSGQLDPAFIRDLQLAASDPAAADALTARLTGLLGDQAEPLLNIADYYEEKDGQPFDLRWPLSEGNVIVTRGISFQDLDRKTQFFVLFAEWQNRETQGMAALMNGDNETARAIFLECIDRADQLDVNELRARSYADMSRLCTKVGDQIGAREWSQKAVSARKT